MTDKKNPDATDKARLLNPAAVLRTHVFACRGLGPHPAPDTDTKTLIDLGGLCMARRSGHRPKGENKSRVHAEEKSCPRKRPGVEEVGRDSVRGRKSREPGRGGGRTALRGSAMRCAKGPAELFNRFASAKQDLFCNGMPSANVEPPTGIPKVMAPRRGEHVPGHPLRTGARAVVDGARLGVVDGGVAVGLLWMVRFL